MFRYILFPAERAMLKSYLETVYRTTDATYQAFKGQDRTTEEMIQLQEFDKSMANFKKELDKTVELVDAGKESEAIANLSSTGEAYHAKEALTKIITAFISKNNNESTVNIQSAKADTIRALILTTWSGFYP